MALWQQIILVLLLGGIIGLFIAALFSMRGEVPRIGRLEEPDPERRGPSPPIVPPGYMSERERELLARMREATGHVDTMMFKVKPTGQAREQDRPSGE